MAAIWRCHQPPETGDLYFKGRAFACAIYRRRGADAAVWITYPDEQAAMRRPAGLADPEAQPGITGSDIPGRLVSTIGSMPLTGTYREHTCGHLCQRHGYRRLPMPSPRYPCHVPLAPLSNLEP